MGKLHSNVQSVDQILEELPSTDMLNKLQQQIYTFIGVQNQFKDHYGQIKQVINQQVQRYRDAYKSSNNQQYSSSKAASSNASLLKDTDRLNSEMQALSAKLTKVLSIVTTEDQGLGMAIRTSHIMQKKQA